MLALQPNNLKEPLRGGSSDLSDEPEVVAEILDELKLLSFSEAFAIALKKFGPYTSSRLLIAGKSFGAGIVTAGCSPDAIQGYALGSLFQQFFLSSVKGGLATIDSFIARFEKEGKREKIGPLINQGLFLGFCVGLPISVLFATSNIWLRSIGISQGVAEQTGNFLKWLSVGFIPTCFSLVDQSFLLSIGRDKPAIALNLFFTGVSVLVGFWKTIATKDPSWLAIGMSIAGIMAFALGRLYLWRAKKNNELIRNVYHLFSSSFDSGVSSSELVSRSIPAALQGFSEWLPSVLTTFIMASKDSPKVDEAQVPSVQLQVACNQVLLALSNAATILTSAEYGTAEKNVDIALKNAKMMGFASTAVTLLFISVPVGLGIAYPDAIVKLFAHSEMSFELAKSMMQITCATLLLDGLRNVLTGALLGRNQPQDNFFTSLTNLMITAGCATVAGYYTKKQFGDLNFFVCKALGIFITNAVLGYYWEVQSDKLKSIPLTECFCGSLSLWKKPAAVVEQGQNMSNVVSPLAADHENDEERQLELGQGGSQKESAYVI